MKPVAFLNIAQPKPVRHLCAVLWMVATGLTVNVRAAPADFSAASAFDVVAVEDTVHLLFAQSVPTELINLELFYTRSNDAGETWSIPVSVPSSHAPPGRHQRGHDPQLAVAGERVMALWTTEGDGPWGSGPLATARSNDGGKTWSAGPAPDHGGDHAGYRFPATTAGKDAFHAVWIHALDDGRALRHARLNFDATAWSPDTVIDTDICACCWNQLETNDSGDLFTLYRDQTPSDMGFAALPHQARNWETRDHAGKFDWNFDGCPHVGGGLAIARNPGGIDVALATVWTGHAEKSGTYILKTRDGGQSWRTLPLPGEINRGHANTDVALLPDGRSAVTWDAPGGNGSRLIWVATSPDAGETWSAPRCVSPLRAFSTHPRAISTKNRFLLFWSESRPGKKWFLAMVPID